MFISDALAADGAQPGGDMSMIIVLTVCMLAVYFFVMRPNSKKRKEMQKLLDNLSVGDEVLTNGGIAGRIVKLPDNKEYVLVQVCDGVVMQMKRNYVVAVLPKGTLADVADSKASTPDAPAAKGEGKGKKKKSKAKAQKTAEALEDKSKEETGDAAEIPADTKEEQPAETQEQPAEVKEEAPAEAPAAVKEAPQEPAPEASAEAQEPKEAAQGEEDKPKA